VDIGPQHPTGIDAFLWASRKKNECCCLRDSDSLVTDEVRRKMDGSYYE
jgi:hypothetical protein